MNHVFNSCMPIMSLLDTLKDGITFGDLDEIWNVGSL